MLLISISSQLNPASGKQHRNQTKSEIVTGIVADTVAIDVCRAPCQALAQRHSG
jgi:hypothetical protein